MLYYLFSEMENNPRFSFGLMLRVMKGNEKVADGEKSVNRYVIAVSVMR